jgi:hypothetical protein
VRVRIEFKTGDGRPTLHATVASHGTDCVCLAGQVWTLTYDSVTQSWKCLLEIDGLRADPLPTTVLNLKLSCSGARWELDITDSGTHSCLASGLATTTQSTFSCSPFQVVFPSVSITECCNGPHCPTVGFTVTA